MVHGADKLILLPMCRPPRVLILQLSFHQYWINVQINLLQPHVHVAALGVRTVGYLEPVLKAVGNNRALLHTMCNVVQVAAWFGYTSGES